MASTKTFLLGINCGLYYNAGTYASPTWTEVTEINDASLSMDPNEVTFPTRASRLEASVKTTYKLAFSFRMKAAAETSQKYHVVRDASLSDTPKDWLILNAKITEPGARGFRFDGLVFPGEETQGVQDMVADQYVVRCTYPTTDATLAVPKTARVAEDGASVTYTAI